jgi:hypothetical protein
VSGVAIRAALCREHGHSGSYSAVRRMLAVLNTARPRKATVRLQFGPGEAAQVLVHPLCRAPHLLPHGRHEIVNKAHRSSVAV